LAYLTYPMIPVENLEALVDKVLGAGQPDSPTLV
jgi:hypothetical protein